MVSPLHEPIRIGKVSLKNRIAMAPMISNLGTPEGYPSDAHILYLAERAKGGVGLIITEYTYVNRVDSRGSVNELGLYSDELIPKFMRLTDMIHSVGSKIFVQLVHVGRKTKRDVIWGNTPIAPSPITLMDEVREMTKEDVERVKGDFVDASLRARRAGFDGVELHGAHGYLLAQFLSPATNKRVDEYSDGKKFVQEIVREIKAKVGITVGVRLSSTEFDEEGLKPEDVAEIARELEKVGVDYVHLSAGRDGPMNSSAPFYYQRPSFLEEAKVVRERVKVPLLVVGSVITMEDALKVREVADVVVLGRELLADPHWVRNSVMGLARPCIRCNQSCRGMVYREVRCDVNPELGWELLPPMSHGEGEVKVVGGGVMGMETARVLGSRGFSVTLVEKDDKLGGQFNMFADPWKVKEFMQLVKFYEMELKRLHVKVVLGREEDCEGCIRAYSEGPPQFPDVKGEKVLIDSNLYAYHDYAFRLVKDNEVYITERSISWMDRTRWYFLQRELESAGVKVVKEKVRADVELNEMVEEQPTIGRAIKMGYWLGRNYVGD